MQKENPCPEVQYVALCFSLGNEETEFLNEVRCIKIQPVPQLIS